MLKQKARFIARVVYFVDLALTSAAFFAAFFIRNVVMPIADNAAPIVSPSSASTVCPSN